MKEATMIFRAPGGHLLHGVMVDYKIVDACDVEECLKDGWARTIPEAHEARAAFDAKIKPLTDENGVIHPPKDYPVTREELEFKAKELGLKFDGRTTDSKLGRMIEEALRG